MMFKDTPASEAFVKYLATPEASAIWAKRGGFSSPNKNMDPNVYPDAITKATEEFNRAYHAITEQLDKQAPSQPAAEPSAAGSNVKDAEVVDAEYAETK
jgi:ABC-type glycerol-3-phosphate transport system substrate-binding protein